MKFEQLLYYKLSKQSQTYNQPYKISQKDINSSKEITLNTKINEHIASITINIITNFTLISQSSIILAPAIHNFLN